MSPDKKTIFSGMQPSDIPHIGNYLGAMRNWAKLQDEYNCLYCVVDMHAITVKQAPEFLRNQSRDLVALYIAVGLDPDKNILYIQSHVRAHAQLSWILGCYTYMGELSRMTQFKEKSQKHNENINAGLFTYPVLMAADILLFQSDLVPVGDDQRQHLELARDIAIRMNNLYEGLFVVPDAYIGKAGARVMSLQDVDKKMSKSEDVNMNNVISLLDEPKTVVNKIKRAVTDSDGTVRHAPEKPGISNLLNIYTEITGKTTQAAEETFSGMGYGAFKQAVADAVVNELTPIQTRFMELKSDTGYLDGVIKNNAEKANNLAETTMRNVMDKVGFVI